jgi:hypothetical protein
MLKNEKGGCKIFGNTYFKNGLLLQQMVLEES